VTGARVYNIACGGCYTLNQLYAALRTRIGSTIDPVYGPPRPGDVKHSMAGIERIERDLGYRVGVSFEEGIDRTVQWYQTVGLKSLR
jgi:nucleoside-diphosphate-sugar epimerase